MAVSSLEGLAQLPEILRHRVRWVCFNFPDKMPRVPSSVGRAASVTDPSTWGTFAEALAAVADGKVDGCGIVLGEGLAGVDLDQCVDADGRLDPHAHRRITALDSYAEYSPSGTGVHVFALGTFPVAGRKKHRVELYSADRYLTVTGFPLPGCPMTVNLRQAALDALYREVFGADSADPALDLVLARMFASVNGALIRQLWNGDTSRYVSASEADAALCNHLAFWTACDAALIDRLFRRSKLYRLKWDERRGTDTYGDKTIRLAIASVKAATQQTTSTTPPEPTDDPLDDLEDGTVVVAHGERLARDGVPYLVEDIIPNFGMLGFLIAYTKVGKSTFAQLLAAAVAMGQPFLERDTHRTRVLILAAEDPPEYTAFLARRLELEAGWLFFRRKPLLLTEPELARISTTIQREHIGFVLIASWQAVVAGLLTDENDNAASVRLVERVKAVTRTSGIPWLIDAHSGKGEDQDDDADPTKAMRGASAAAAAADFTLSLRYGNGAFGTQRRFSGKGRFVTAASVTLEFDISTHCYTVLGNPKTVHIETDWQLLRTVLSTTPQSLTDLARACGVIAATERLTGGQRQRLLEALRNRPTVGIRQELRRGQKTTLYFLLEATDAS